LGSSEKQTKSKRMRGSSGKMTEALGSILSTAKRKEKKNLAGV
jgi:hypothetical protein